ncbi:MAG: hypothetical protein HFE78_04410 [Clostridiales bacterium]|nr:hypothetical protein [Clostridiales bacterium]
MRLRKFLSAVLALVVMMSACPALVYSQAAQALTGPVPLGEPVRLVSADGNGAFMSAFTFTPEKETCFTLVFDIQGATQSDPYTIGGVTGSLNGGINPNNSANMPVGWTVSYMGNGTKYLSVGFYCWQWLDYSTFQVNSLSLSDPKGTRSGPTDLGANTDATFELLDIVMGGAAYDITFKSEDGSETYHQSTGTLSNPNQWAVANGDFPALADLYAEVPVKQDQGNVSYEFAGWVDEDGKPVSYAAGTKTVYASYKTVETRTLNTLTAVSPSLAAPDEMVRVTVTPDLQENKIKDGAMTLSYDSDVVRFVSAETGSAFESLQADFVDDGKGTISISYGSDEAITNTSGPLFSFAFQTKSLASAGQKSTFALSSPSKGLSDAEMVYTVADDHAGGVLTIASDAVFSVYEQGVRQEAVPFTEEKITLIGEQGLYAGAYHTHAGAKAIGFVFDVTGVTSPITIGDVFSTFKTSQADVWQNTNNSSAAITENSTFTAGQPITQDGRYIAWLGHSFLSDGADASIETVREFHISDGVNASTFAGTVNANTNAAFRLVGIAEAHTDTLPQVEIVFRNEDGQLLQTVTVDYSGGCTDYRANACCKAQTVDEIFTESMPDKVENGVRYRFMGWQTKEGVPVRYADRSMTLYPIYEEMPTMALTLKTEPAERDSRAVVRIGCQDNTDTASVIAFNLLYDASVYTYQQASAAIEGASITVTEPQAGVLAVQITSDTGISGSAAALAEITFAVSEDAPAGHYAFTVQPGSEASLSASGKEYWLEGASVQGTVTELMTYYDYENQKPAGRLVGTVMTPPEKWSGNVNKDVTLAIDGDYNTMWRCSGQNYYTAKLQYYGFDFGGQTRLSSITFKASGYSSVYGGLRLEVSNDNLTWQTIWADADETCREQIITVDAANWDRSVMTEDSLWRYIRLAYGNEEEYAGWSMLAVYELAAEGQVVIPKGEKASGFTNENPTGQTLPVLTLPSAAVSGGISLIGPGSLYESATGLSEYTMGTDNQIGFTVALRFEGIETPVTISNWNANWKNYQATNAGNGVSKFKTTIEKDGTYLLFFPVNTITWTGSLTPFMKGETIRSLKMFDAGNKVAGAASKNENENAVVSLLGIYDGFIPSVGVRFEVNDGDMTGRYYAYTPTGIEGKDSTSDTAIRCVRMTPLDELFLSAMPARSEPQKANAGTNAYTYNGWKDADGRHIDAAYQDMTVYVSFEESCAHTAPVKTQTIEPTCTQEGMVITTCTGCGQVIDTRILPALGHSYTERVLKEATYLNTGIKQFVCERDGDSYTEEMPLLVPDESAPRLAVGDKTAYAEGIVEIPVTLTNNPGVASLCFFVETDSANLTLLRAAKGTLFDTIEVTPVAGTNLTQITLSNREPITVTADGTAAVLTYSVSASALADEVYTISVTAAALYENELAKNLTGDLVAIAPVAGKMTIGTHTHESVVVGGQPPSYWHTYYTGDTVCPVCGKIFAAGTWCAPLALTDVSPYVKVDLALEGSVCTATLSLKNNPGLAGLAFDFVYDEEAFALASVSFGGLFDNEGSSFTDHAEGPVRLVFDSATAAAGVEEDGVLAVLTFTLNEDYVPGDKSFAIALGDQMYEMGYDYALHQVSVGAKDGVVHVS